MKKITIYEYFANNCPQDAYDLLSQEGGNYQRPQTPQELEGQLKDYVNKNGEKGLLKLAEIHPDKELITMVCDCKKTKNKSVAEKKDNFSNANGNSNISDSQSEQINLAKMMIFGGFILVGIALIMKK
jgi:hypothetical protein